MKEYKKPKIEIIELKAEDIIKTSGEVIISGDTIKGGRTKFKDSWKTSSDSSVFE